MWHYHHDRYYTLLIDQPCRYPDCQAACLNNNATLAFPTSKDNLDVLRRFLNPLTGTAYVGLSLPVLNWPFQTCAGSECNNRLLLSNNTAFQHQKWMMHQFDRLPEQPPCYKYDLHAKVPEGAVIPSECDLPLLALCKALCPRPGAPINPPPLELQDQTPLDFQMIKAETARSRREAPIKDDLSSDAADFMPIPTSNTAFLQSLPAFPTDPNYGAPVTVTEKDFVAYDCNVPRELTAVQMGHNEDPCMDNPTPVSQQNATYVLAQKADHIPTTIKSCRITQSKFPYYCGVWSHTVVATHWFSFSEDIPISQAICDHMWNTGEWEDPKGNAHKVLQNSTTRVVYHLVGSSSSPPKAGGPVCHGEDYHYGGHIHHHMVVPVTVLIELFQYPATVDEQQLVSIPHLSLTLPCPYSKHTCITHRHGTFNWDRKTDADMCPYFQIRNTSGILVQDAQSRNLYISTDNTMLRLIVNEPIHRCGHVLYKTNYEKLFLTTKSFAQDFPNMLPNREMSVYTYVNMQDNFMMGTLTRYIQQEFTAVHLHSCQTSVARERFNYDRILAEQHGSTDGDTAALGGGYFLTVAGEAFYRYRCRRLIVQARSTDTCYSSLPVSLTKMDLIRYATERGLNASKLDAEFFIEPHSRQLTTRGIKIPCSSTFTPLYASAKKTWLKADKDLTPSIMPEALDLKAFNDLPLHTAEDWDFEEGGIYTKEQIRAHESHLGIARAAKDVQYTMGQKAQIEGWTSSTNSHRFSFSPDQIIKQIVQFNPIDYLLSGFYKWGKFCAGIAGIYYAIYGSIYIFSCARLLLFPANPAATTIRRISNAIQEPIMHYHRRRGGRRGRAQYEMNRRTSNNIELQYMNKKRKISNPEQEDSIDSSPTTSTPLYAKIIRRSETTPTPRVSPIPPRPEFLPHRPYVVRPKPSPSSTRNYQNRYAAVTRRSLDNLTTTHEDPTWNETTVPLRASTLKHRPKSHRRSSTDISMLPMEMPLLPGIKALPQNRSIPGLVEDTVRKMMEHMTRVINSMVEAKTYRPDLGPQCDAMIRSLRNMQTDLTSKQLTQSMLIAMSNKVNEHEHQLDEILHRLAADMNSPPPPSNLNVTRTLGPAPTPYQSPTTTAPARNNNGHIIVTETESEIL